LYSAKNLHITGCVVDCRISKQEVAGSNLGQGYFAPMSTQSSIPLGLVNEYQLLLGRQRQEQLIPLVDETQGVQVNLCYPLTMHDIPECLRDVSCGDAIQIDYLYFFIGLVSGKVRSKYFWGMVCRKGGIALILYTIPKL